MLRIIWSQLAGSLFCAAVRRAMTALAVGVLPQGAIAFEIPRWGPDQVAGVVMDTETRLPLEGAYVLAAYHESIVDPAVVKQWCVRTKGMVTGPDGKFRFPVEKRDGMSPASVQAIKSGYFRGLVDLPDQGDWRRQSAKAYANWNVYLTKQQAGKPVFRYGFGDEFCNHAKTREDAAAAVEFKSIELAEMERLRAPQHMLDAGKAMIERMKTMPSGPPPTSDRWTEPRPTK